MRSSRDVSIRLYGVRLWLVIAAAVAGPVCGHAQSIKVEQLGSQGMQWTFGNASFRQRLALDEKGFRCTSLSCWRTGREWIDPTASSDEFKAVLETADHEQVTLMGLGEWTCVDHTERQDVDQWRELRIILKSKQKPLTVTRFYRWHQSFPVVRQWTIVENSGPDAITVRQLDTFRLRLRPTLDDLELRWMNNYCRGLKLGSGSPIHYRSIGQNVEHVIRSGPYSPDCGWFCLTIPQPNEGLVGGWEWSSPMAVRFGDLSASCLIHGGLDPEGMHEALPPGGTLEAPAGWYGFFEGDLDEAAALCHELVRTSWGPLTPAKDYPWVGYCTWACSMDGEKSPYNEKGAHPWFPTEKNLLSQVEAAAELGFELFLWDYGWFPRIGDWWFDKTRFPNGPRVVADVVHARGMKLGLWVGFGNANEQSRVVREHPDWRATYRSKPIPDDFFIRCGASVWGERILCLAHGPAREWAKQQLLRLVEECQLDWLKHDFDLITICQSTEHTHTPGDSRIAACEGFYEIMDAVRAKYPHLVCENWLNNTGTPDFGVLRRHQVQLIGDAYRPFVLRQMFYGHSQIFPADRQHRYLRLYGSQEHLRYKIRSASYGGPWTLLEDPRMMTADAKRVLKEEIDLYKKLRHLSTTGKLYRLIRRPHPHGWDAIEFWDADQGEGVVYVFRNGCATNVQPVVLKGLEPDNSYELSFVDGRVSKTVTGRALLTRGVSVELPEEMSSEIITVRHVGR